jgi:hypothetical protein
LCRTGLATAVVSFVVGTALAQQPPVARDTSGAGLCAGERVVGVDFVSKPPPMIGDRVPGALRSVLRAIIQHTPSTRHAVEPFMLLAPGDECSVERIAESVRMLRAQPYLADASIVVMRDPGGGVRLLVETTDEIPLILGGAWRDGNVSSVTYGNGNIAGRGISAEARWDQGFAYRDGFGAELAHYHLVGRSMGRFAAVRGSLHEYYRAALTRAYLTNVQHTAWHVGAQRQEGFVDYLREDDDALSLALDRDLIDAGLLVRVGPSRRRLLMGLVASHEHVDPASRGIVIADTGFAADPDTVLVGRYASWTDTRVGAVVSGRWVDFEPLVGLDSAAGRQDVATGMQFALTVGHGLASDRRDPFTAFDLYAATIVGRSLFAFHAITEGRRPSPGGWADVVAGGQFAWYRKPTPRRTRMVRAELSGAWNMTLPLQLALSDRRGGVRGYRGSDEAGARRAVLRFEERLSLGGVGGIAGLGIAGFGDLGKLWAGEVPFGTTTAVRPGLGLGILASVPRGSQRVFRLDLAVPLVRDGPTRSWSLRLSSSMPYEAFWREPNDLRRMRAGRPVSELLVWQ